MSVDAMAVNDGSHTKDMRKSLKSKEKHDSGAGERNKSSRKKAKLAEAGSEATDRNLAQAAEHIKDKKRKKKDVKSAAEVAAQFVAEDSVKIDGKPRKNKRSDRNQAEQSVAEEGAARDAVTLIDKKRKKKSRKQQDSVDDVPQLLTDDDKNVGDADGQVTAQDRSEDAVDAKKTRKEKRKHKKDASEGAQETVEAEGKPMAKEKRKHKKDASEGAQQTQQAEEEPVAQEKHQRRKRKRDTDVQEDGSTTKEHKKKKRKQDPNNDESLSEQARKALHYAFTQFDDPVSWKFNKARQNWLIRNVWSARAITDEYMTLLQRYLANMKGGARDALIKSCRDMLEDQPTSDVAVGSTEQAAAKPSDVEPSNPTGDIEIKRSRASALLAVLVHEQSS
ncbi:uncharacterized protein LAESUDRAFT_689896 [Laetiporus sulphureus 93-53]|uniref:WKF domain-containing protein n=1 Tax=Laetiporus sulphureus 93-53 TaxID=1314785 RepID=A0A165IDA2_9APHY|nr:uncharacterized protein LAESUDRAFT_689896 [Laetiporus sulphureus 93-53]KZT12920.1 hypothetical protein LAESUDRAFT_689896 [Laetiporus sulphureus 93-53]